MNEEHKPCALCGKPALRVMRNRFSIDTVVCCPSRECSLSQPMPIEDWNRLSDMATLSRAVEGLESRRPYALLSVDVGGKRVQFESTSFEPTLAAALVSIEKFLLERGR